MVPGTDSTQLVDAPDAYVWLSARFYLQGQELPLVTANPEDLAIGPTPADRHSRYRDYLQTERPYERIVDRYFDERVLIA